VTETPPTPGQLLEAALAYASWGWKVVPLHDMSDHGRCSCGRDCGNSRGKHPRYAKWQEEASDNPSIIRDWWRHAPYANVGVKLGTCSGIVAVDVDPPNGEDTLRAISGGDLPPTMTVATGKGRRLLYAIADGLDREPQTVPLKDETGETVRCQGGNSGAQCVLPPSWHYAGRQYRWQAGQWPGSPAGRIAPMPTWLVRLMCPPERPRPAASPPPDPTSPFAEFNLRGDWWSDVLEPAGAKPCRSGRGGVEYVTRPGKDGGISASLGFVKAQDGTPALYVFSGNWPGLAADRSYDKSGALCRLAHGGDFASCARALAAKGYGRDRDPASMTLPQKVVYLERRVRQLEDKLKALANPATTWDQSQVQELGKRVLDLALRVRKLEKPAGGA
jgi:hypothetical protein